MWHRDDGSDPQRDEASGCGWHLRLYRAVPAVQHQPVSRRLHRVRLVIVDPVLSTVWWRHDDPSARTDCRTRERHVLPAADQHNDVQHRRVHLAVNLQRLVGLVVVLGVVWRRRVNAIPGCAARGSAWLGVH